MSIQETRSDANGDMGVFRPPIIRSGTTALNRALFSKQYDLAAAKVHDIKNVSKYRKSLEKSGSLLRQERISAIVDIPNKDDPAAKTAKALLLNPSISVLAPNTWGEAVREGVESNDLGIVPYTLELDYNYWSARDVLRSLLPEEFQDDIQSAFNTAGHVAHLNLRSLFLPYKHIIAQVIFDKTPNIKTVINKIDNVGTESEFRTFAYEVLAGPDDLNVEVRENNCTFKFDYSKVYWNSKLEGEHTRLINDFQPGEVVCDVMAGIGPFAVPAGRKGVFVWANDMNPESFNCLKDSIDRNKVSQFVRPFNHDGRSFIRKAADSVLAASRNGERAVIKTKPKKGSRSNPAAHPPSQDIPVPPTISHFVMNLPASAITFLPFYKGLYAGQEALFAPHTETKLPFVHVHCFAVKSDDDTPKLDVCARVTEQLGVEMRLGDPEKDKEVSVHHVRNVAPAKSMFCATFRIPEEVAFAQRGEL